MDYHNIQKFLGENWLNKQIGEIESKLWIEDSTLRDKINNNPAYFILIFRTNI